MNKLRTLKNKKGFTLVEIIVVLVILAILAAFGIPSMIGFIDDARGKALLAEARSVYTALQIVLTEDSMKNPSLIDSSTTKTCTGGIADAMTSEATTDQKTAYVKRITDLLAPDIKYEDVDVSTTTKATIPDFRVTKGQVLGLVYQKGTVCIAFASGKPAQDFNGTDALKDAKEALTEMLK